MDWATFHSDITQIKTLSDRLNDDWELVQNLEAPEKAYLSKKAQKQFGNDLVTFEYHIAYHQNYQAPLLCFIGWKRDGSVVSLEECWKYLGLNDEDLKFSIITQMEHPVLLRPYFGLHPCKSVDLLANTKENSKNQVVSWLSVVGPLIKLCLHFDYNSLT